MRRRVVFDVNTLVSAMLSPNGAPALAIRAAAVNHWEIVRSNHIEEKLQEVLLRPHLTRILSDPAVSRFIGAYKKASELVFLSDAVPRVADDEEDDRIIATAIIGNADLLVTGDKGLLRIGEYRGVRIVTAAAFLAELDVEAKRERRL